MKIKTLPSMQAAEAGMCNLSKHIPYGFYLFARDLMGYIARPDNSIFGSHSYFQPYM